MEQEALSAAAQQFTDAGATLVLISPQFPEHSAAIAEEKGLNIDILGDVSGYFNGPDNITIFEQRIGRN
jgi:peroxiredoxin